MKSHIDSRYIDASRYGRQNGQNDIAKEAQRRMDNLKMRKAKKRRRRHLIKLFFKSAIMLTLLLFAGVFLCKIVYKISLDIDRNKIDNIQYENGKSQEQDSNEVMQLEVGKPLVREGNELINRLKSLSNEYPDFMKIYNNRDAYPEELIASLCNNPEMIDFVKGYLTSDGTVTGDINENEVSKDYPLFLQWDKRWGYAPYGDNNIALSGCAPTCLSMVITELTKNAEASPDVVADYAMTNGYYISGTGTKWSLMTEGSEHYGIQGRELNLSKNSIFSELEEGNPIICSLRPGDFTTAGHFIVLVGVRNGKIRVNDPNCKERSSKLWDYDTLEYQIKNLWVFTKPS